MSRKRINGTPTENFGVAQDEHRFTHQPVSNAIKIKLDHLRTFDALTENQQKFFNIYKEGGYLIGLLGSPGVGKTFLALYRALEEVLNKDNPFKQVVVVRSTVTVRDVGFLPGTVDEKISIYEQPYKEICTTLFGRPDVWDRLKEQGYARFIPTSFVRGLTIDDSIIVVDECQNMTWGELSTVVGRVGHRSKIIFCGDKFQNDLVRQKNDVSGLEEFLDVLKTMHEFEAVYFTPDDIVRSSMVKSFIKACEKKGRLPGH
jgi:phosphate starvation-inducible protein PhoH